MGLFQQSQTLCLCLLVFKTCTAGTPNIGQIYPSFETSQINWIDFNGLFLLSNNSVFGFGFYFVSNIQSFFLGVVHVGIGNAVWTANRDLMISNTDKFVFDRSGNVYLQKGNGVVWSPNTSGQKVTSIELRDSGNLVLLGDSGDILWQSFGHPTDTLLPGQEFLEGMRLKSSHTSGNFSVYLEFKSGDLVLYADYKTPQTYWSLANELRRIINYVGGKVYSASLVDNSWKFYDQNKTLLSQLVFSGYADKNATWAAILGSDGTITFPDLQNGKTVTPEQFKIPENSCGSPEPCDPYYLCSTGNRCRCPISIPSAINCKPPIASTCNSSNDSTELLYVGENLDYFALEFVTPFSRYSLDACKEACLRNCSCSVLFFESDSQDCFLFDQIGSFQSSQQGSVGYVTYVKFSSDKKRNRPKRILIIVFTVVASLLVFAGLLCLVLWHCCRKKRTMKFSREDLEEDHFLDNLSGMPVRFSYNDLCRSTKNFSAKIGQGGFGSVYLGVLADGTQLAVKKLEGIGQGKKEFRAEVSTIGKVHHLHLVKLRGFCAEGPHRLLVYEYMGNGSLSKWIFKINEENQLLSWNARFNIALGTAKGLAYLHSECEVKVVHCDIKPENVLLDDNFTAKVSDFGLAKLMKHDENLAYTTLRGTRGYLAPEWIKNHPISEKSDVFSYGVVLLEIISCRRSYDPGDDSAKAHLPSYAFRMLEEEKLREIIDSTLDIDENDERVVTAIKVALWCIQEKMHLRPPMTKVVQMLKGICAVPDPPTPSQLSSQEYSGFNINWSSKEDPSLCLLDDNNGGTLSDIRLSGPR